MIRRTALSTAVGMALLLGACSKNEGAAPHAEGAASHGAGLQADYWSAVGPLVAGTYRAGCIRLSDSQRLDTDIAVGADGKVAASGYDMHLREAGLTMLARHRDSEGRYATTATFTTNVEEAGMFSLQAGETGEGGALLTRGDFNLSCSGIAGLDKLNARPLYQALASIIDGKKQTLSCLDAKSLGAQRNLDVEFTGGVIKVGNASFDIRTAAGEMVGFDSAGGVISVEYRMPDKSAISLAYDAAGKLTTLVGTGGQGMIQSCQKNG